MRIKRTAKPIPLRRVLRQCNNAFPETFRLLPLSIHSNCGAAAFLKLRRQRHVVPSVMLWLEAIEDMKANVPFQRLRNSLLLPLQILFLLIVVGGVARPALRQLGGLSEQSIVIIDTSASMGATDLGETRLDVAKAEALKLINQLGANGQMMIMDTSRPRHNIRQALHRIQKNCVKLLKAVRGTYSSNAQSGIRFCSYLRERAGGAGCAEPRCSRSCLYQRQFWDAPQFCKPNSTSKNRFGKPN